MNPAPKIRLIVIAALALLLSACGGTEAPNRGNPEAITTSINRFSAYPATVTEGETARLSWQVSGVEEGSVFINPGNVALPKQGNLTVLPGHTVTYTLSAVKQNGELINETIVVTVLPKDAPVDEGNNAPEISGDAQGLSVSGPEILELDLDAVDEDGDALEWRIGIGAGKGYAVVDADGVVNYQAFPGESGQDTFTVEVSDGEATDAIELSVDIL